MQSAQLDLASRMAHTSRLISMPNDAWAGAVLGEASYTRQQMIANDGELIRYLGHLGTALNNIGMAAQTVADIYSSTDGTSAASLDAVKFAFGDQSVPRPAGLPPGVGQTYWDKYLQERANGEPPLPATSEQWSAPVASATSPYQTTQVSTAANGQRREITTTQVPGSSTLVVTTTVYGADGRVLGSSSERSTTYTSGSTITTATETYQNGKLTGSTEKDTTYTGGEVTTEITRNEDGKGNSTGGIRETVDHTGSTTTVTVNGKGEETDKVVVGPQTQGQLTPQEPLAKQHDPYLNG